MKKSLKLPALVALLTHVVQTPSFGRPASSGTTFGGIILAAAVAFQALIGVSAFVKPAAAQNACITRTQAVKSLSENYSEAQVAVGLASNGGVLEVFTSADGATWTVIYTSPRGTSCLVASGEGWVRLQPRVSLGPAL